jgi:O-methyltransferase involved in polyketide biosynthesis
MKIRPDLAGVPETMLWTLHNRACEAKKAELGKAGALIRDPEAARIYDRIDYDFVRRFGRPEGSHAVRSADIDAILRRWLAAHADGWVVALGEGLETQFSRVDNGSLNWLTVDLPEAIHLREQLLPANPRCRRFTGSALDRRWLEIVADGLSPDRTASGQTASATDTVQDQLAGRNLCIIFMYLPEAEIRRLLTDLAARFPGCLLIFDSIPRWLSYLTQRPRGLKRTAHYTMPPMPWGINCNEVAATLRQWDVSDESETKSYRLPRGMPRLMTEICAAIPRLRPQVPAITWAVLRSPVLPPATTQPAAAFPPQ